MPRFFKPRQGHKNKKKKSKIFRIINKEPTLHSFMSNLFEKSNEDDYLMQTEQNYDISKLKQQAEIAHEIQRIITDPDNFCQNQTVLIDKLRNLQIHDIKSQSISSQNLRYMINQLFIKGVQLPSYLSKIDRLRKGLNEQKKFKFMPSWIASSKIFSFLANLSYTINRYWGNSGIGKTSSLILFQRLNNYKTKYACRLDKQSQDFKSFKEKYRPKKYIYYNYQQQIDSCIKKNLIEQCPEMLEANNVLNTEQQLQSIIQSICKFYENKNIPIVIIIEQINKLTSLCRQYNNQRHSSKQNTQQLIRQQEKIRREIQKIHQIRRLGLIAPGYVIYTTSQNCQQRLLGKSFCQNYLTLNLQIKHTCQANFQSRKKTMQGKKEFRRINQLLYNKNNSIRMILQNQQNKPDQEVVPTDYVRKSISQGNIRSAHDIQQQQLSQNFRQLWFKISSNQSDQQIFAHMIQYIKNKINKKIMQEQYDVLQIRIDQFHQATRGVFKNVPRITDYIDKRLFPGYGNVFTASLPILKIQELINQNLDKYYTMCLRWISIYGIDEDSSVIGTLLQKAFIDSIKKSSKNKNATIILDNKSFNISHIEWFIHYNQNSQDAKQMNKIKSRTIPKEQRCNKELKNQLYKKQKQDIRKILQKIQPQKYKDNLKMVIQKAQKFPDQYIVSEPSLPTTPKKKSVNSFCVDLLIARYILKTKTYQFLFYDCKVSSNIDKKGKDFDIDIFKARVMAGLKDLKIDNSSTVDVALICLPQNYKACKKLNLKCINIYDINFKGFQNQNVSRFSALITALKQKTKNGRTQKSQHDQ